VAPQPVGGAQGGEQQTGAGAGTAADPPPAPAPTAPNASTAPTNNSAEARVLSLRDRLLHLRMATKFIFFF